MHELGFNMDVVGMRDTGVGAYKVLVREHCVGRDVPSRFAVADPQDERDAVPTLAICSLHGGRVQ
jgi:hypothetical protein